MGYLSKALLAAAFTCAAAGAQAATITASKNTTERAQVTCPACVGYVAAGVTSPTAAQTENATPSNKNAEADFVNRMTTSTSFQGNHATKVNTNGVGTLDFVSSFQYIVFKIGNQRFLIENFAANSLFEFDERPGTGSGLSHYTGFGVVAAEIPLPATGILLASVLLGGGAMARRRRKAA